MLQLASMYSFVDSCLLRHPSSLGRSLPPSIMLLAKPNDKKKKRIHHTISRKQRTMITIPFGGRTQRCFIAPSSSSTKTSAAVANSASLLPPFSATTAASRAQATTRARVLARSLSSSSLYETATASNRIASLSRSLSSTSLSQTALLDQKESSQTSNNNNNNNNMHTRSLALLSVAALLSCQQSSSSSSQQRTLAEAATTVSAAALPSARQNQKASAILNAPRPKKPHAAVTDAAPSSFSNNDNYEDEAAKEGETSTCPFYGCPLLPEDVHYNTEQIKETLKSMRQLKATEVAEQGLLRDIPHFDRRDAACLSLIGYKGGSLDEQINQDRGFVVSPFYLDALEPDDEEDNNTTKSDSSAISSSMNKNRVLVGVFDGHAPRGEIISEYVIQELPTKLAHKLRDLPPQDNKSDSSSADAEQKRLRQDATVAALSETFIELDAEVPGNPSGGCTASIVLRQDDDVYIANAGDSRSLIVTYRPSTGVARVVYISREDKPSLPDERARVEAAGGSVYLPAQGTSRVVYTDPQSGMPTGLAMSRSIGDWEAGKAGVVPDPLVDILDLNELVAAELAHRDDQKGTKSATNQECLYLDPEGEVDAEACQDYLNSDDNPADGNDSDGAGSSRGKDAKHEVDDVHIFAVSASDGMMDYLQPKEVARVLATSLFEEDGLHPVTSCELLIYAAANAWQQDKKGRYRDDITISVGTLRRPPALSSSELPTESAARAQ